MRDIKPSIKLQEGEEVKLVILRSRASLLGVWIAEALLIVAFVAALIFLGTTMNLNDGESGSMLRNLIIILLVVVVGWGLLSTYLNFKNKMFITNRRVIYQKVENLLSNKIKTIELTKIESVNYAKQGLLPHIMKYGTLKLATLSDETTYVFPYCGTPRDEVEKISDIVETSRRTKSAQVGHAEPTEKL